MCTILSSTELHRLTGDVLDRVAAGEEIIIERNGNPIVKLVAVVGSHHAIRDKGGMHVLVSDEELIAPIMDEM